MRRIKTSLKTHTAVGQLFQDGAEHGGDDVAVGRVVGELLGEEAKLD